MYNNKGRWNLYYNNPRNGFFYDSNYSFRRMKFWRDNQKKTFNNFINYVIEHEIPLLTDEFLKLSEGDFEWDYIMKNETLQDDILHVMDLAEEPLANRKKMNRRGANSSHEKNKCIYSKEQYDKLLKLEEKIMNLGDYSEEVPKGVNVKT